MASRKIAPAWSPRIYRFPAINCPSHRQFSRETPPSAYSDAEGRALTAPRVGDCIRTPNLAYSILQHYGRGMATNKVTFTLDAETVHRIEDCRRTSRQAAEPDRPRGRRRVSRPHRSLQRKRNPETSEDLRHHDRANPRPSPAGSRRRVERDSPGAAIGRTIDSCREAQVIVLDTSVLIDCLTGKLPVPAISHVIAMPTPPSRGRVPVL